MTEAKWLACTDAALMYRYLCERRSKRRGWFAWLQPASAPTSERKLRLFACACCMRIWDLIPTQPARDCVLAAEQYADGLAPQIALDEAIRTSMASCDINSEHRQHSSAWSHVEREAINAVGRCHRSWEAGRGVSLRAAAAARSWACLRDKLVLLAKRSPEEANNFAESGFHSNDPTWLACYALEGKQQANILRDIVGNPFRPVAFDPSWRTATVLALAEAIYTDRAFDRLPILADALEEAGCTSSDILDHCRQPGDHVRGCWVVDAVLMKN